MIRLRYCCATCPISRVQPPQAAHCTCFLRQGDPVAADAVPLDVAPQLLVLLRRPRPPLHARLVAARRAPHRLALQRQQIKQEGISDSSLLLGQQTARTESSSESVSRSRTPTGRRTKQAIKQERIWHTGLQLIYTQKLQLLKYKAAASDRVLLLRLRLHL